MAIPVPGSEKANRILPLTSSLNQKGHLVIGGCDTVELAREYGTPLYIFDEVTIRTRCNQYVSALRQRYPDSLVAYASKAYTGPALLQIVAQEGLGLDVVSGGELYVAHAVGFPMDRVYFHGNNKGPEELEMALQLGVGRIVVDNSLELEMLERMATAQGKKVAILLRLSTGVEAHTHDYIKTAILDSKFGFPIVTGQAEEALLRAMGSGSLELLGVHAHIGSQIFELAPFVETIRIAMAFAAQMRDRHGFQLRELSPGGGWGISYTLDDSPATVEMVADAVVGAVEEAARELGLPLPRLVMEPGRSIVGQAGVALYRVGATKDIPGVRRYVSVDGGMSDNIRPAIYGSRYEALLANRAAEEATELVTIAGKFCESGDLLIKDVMLPRLAPGDLLAVPASGAYCIPMSSNYNMATKPAIVLVREGKARLIRRRQSYEDLVANDLGL